MLSKKSMSCTQKDQRLFHVSTLILSNRLSHESLNVMADDPPQPEDPKDAVYIDDDARSYALFVAQLLLGYL